ncbi:MAG TPA: Hsp20/alpha crystallin family protein [Usitatibacter sp.]|nr:Hsp20/alpha crystallin family protein [Usitatibacter sp.]
MTNIVRNDPFQAYVPIDPFRDMELLGAPWNHFRRWMHELPAEPMMKLDVAEDEKAFHVKAELPGVKKEDISIEVEGKRVSIAAEVKREAEEKRGETLHSERYFGRQSRTFLLGCEIDRESVEAKLAEGVLHLTLPKSSAVKVAKIAVG